MDAISFVLGVKSKQLRSGQLKDLVYRGRRKEPRKSNFPGDVPATASDDDDEDEDGEGEDEEGGAGAAEGSNDASSAWVCAVFHQPSPESEGGVREWRFRRGMTVKDGVSKYQIDNKVVSFGEYVEGLK